MGPVTASLKTKTLNDNPYFIVGDYLKKYKPAIFGALAFALLFILGFYFFRSYNNSSDIENETGAPEKTTIEIKYDQQNPLIIKQADPNI